MSKVNDIDNLLENVDLAFLDEPESKNISTSKGKEENKDSKKPEPKPEAETKEDDTTTVNSIPAKEEDIKKEKKKAKRRKSVKGRIKIFGENKNEHKKEMKEEANLNTEAKEDEKANSKTAKDKMENMPEDDKTEDKKKNTEHKNEQSEDEKEDEKEKTEDAKPKKKAAKKSNKKKEKSSVEEVLPANEEEKPKRKNSRKKSEIENQEAEEDQPKKQIESEAGTTGEEEIPKKKKGKKKSEAENTEDEKPKKKGKKKNKEEDDADHVRKPTKLKKKNDGGKERKSKTLPPELEGDPKDVVLNYMIAQNRPYSIVNICDNLRGSIKKKELASILDELTKEGKLICKEYNTKVYLANQNNFPEVTDEELKELDQRAESLRADIARNKEIIHAKKSELNALLGEFTDQELKEEIAKEEANVAKLKEKCRKIQANEIEPIPQEKMEAAIKEREAAKKKYKKLKGIIMDLISNFSEGMEISEQQVMEQIGIEGDEELLKENGITKEDLK